MTRIIKGTGRDGSVAYVGAADGSGIFMVDSPDAAIRGDRLDYFKELAEKKWPGLAWTFEKAEPRIKPATGGCDGRRLCPLPSRGKRILRSTRHTS